MKIYCILLDAFPLVNEIEEFAKENKFEQLLQISHGYTSPTLMSMFTGKNPSSLMPKGYGYNGYLDEQNFCGFRSNYSDYMIDTLAENDFVFHNNNRIGFCCRDILAVGCNGVEMPEGINALKFGDYYIDKVSAIEKFKHVRLTESNPESNDSFSGFGIPKLCAEWYGNESSMIKEIQGSNDNLFYLHQTHHWGATNEVGWTKPLVDRSHAIEHTIEWLSNWDFNEPDSIFWIFCDHGLPNDDNKLVYPNSYLSWALVKDNTTNPIKINRKVIHPTDFYPTMMKKIGAKYSSDIDGQCISESLDMGRVYTSEDARLAIDPHYTTNYSLISIDRLNERGIPSRMIQATYFKPNNSVTMIDYNFFIEDLSNNANMFGKNMSFVSDVEVDQSYKTMLSHIEQLVS